MKIRRSERCQRNPTTIGDAKLQAIVATRSYAVRIDGQLRAAVSHDAMPLLTVAYRKRHLLSVCAAHKSNPQDSQ
jgi:hypothetical protein